MHGSADRETDRSASTWRALWVLCGIQLALWTLVPTLVNASLPLDVVEAIAWGGQWQWGYDKHPPLSAWLAEAFYVAGGGDWALYLLSQVCVVLAFVAVYRLCVEALGPGRALLATLAMQGVTYHQFTSPEFNVNVAQLPCWAWTFYFFWRALRENRPWQWAAIGACVGLGILSKYLAGLIVFPLLLFPLLSKPHRWVFRGYGMYLAMAVTTLVVLPHLKWAMENDWITLTYGVRRAGGGEDGSWLDHVWHPLDFTLAQLAAGAGMAPIFWTWGLRRKRAEADGPSSLEAEAGPGTGASSAWRPVDAKRFLVLMAFTPLAAFLLLSVVTGFELRSMWGTPLLLLWGAVVVAQFRFVSISGWKMRWVPPVAVSVLMAVVYAVGTWMSVAWRDKGKRTNFDAAAFVAELDRTWAEHGAERGDGGGTPIPIVVGNVWEAAVANVYAASRPVPYLYGDPQRARWVDDAAVRARGAVLVWVKASRADAPESGWAASPFGEADERFGQVVWLPDLVVPWAGDAAGALAGGGTRFGLGVVPAKE